MGLVQADTNVVLSFSREDHPGHESTMKALERLRERGDRLVIASQNLAEFWAVATRPAGSPNGLGYSPSEAKRAVDKLVNVFDRLPDLDAAFPIGRDLIERYGVSGKTTHDARLVATMRANGVDRILTFNVRDFARFAEIAVESPQARPRLTLKVHPHPSFASLPTTGRFLSTHRATPKGQRRGAGCEASATSLRTCAGFPLPSPEGATP